MLIKFQVAKSLKSEPIYEPDRFIILIRIYIKIKMVYFANSYIENHDEWKMFDRSSKQTKLEVRVPTWMVLTMPYKNIIPINENKKKDLKLHSKILSKILWIHVLDYTNFSIIGCVSILKIVARFLLKFFNSFCFKFQR